MIAMDLSFLMAKMAYYLHCVVRAEHNKRMFLYKMHTEQFIY